MNTATPGSNPSSIHRCESCNARQRPDRLSLAYMLHRVREDLFGAERGLAITVWHLFTRPQAVVSGFVEGNNLRYYSPIKYFVVTLALSLLLPNDSFFDDFIVGMFESMKVFDSQAVKGFVHDWNALVYLPMLVMLALSTRSFFRGKAYNFSENLVVAAYGWSQMVIIGALVFSFGKLLSWLELKNILFAILMFAPVIYWFWYCREVFSQRSLAGWVRAFVTLPFAVLCYMFLMIFLAAGIKAVQHFH